jgi:hypothetical protein
MKKKSTHKFKCPLCSSSLSEVKYYEIVGVWDEKAKAEKEIKKELDDAKRQKQQMIAQHNAEKRKFEREKKAAIKDGIEKGKHKEKARADLLAKRANVYLQEIQHQNKKIKELEKHLKAGTTPQTAGLEFEKELVKQLVKEFSSDKIEAHGKGGDILHRVYFKSKEIGSILYECKKTGKFQPDYVHQTKRAIAQRNATYGVLVTFATKKNAQGFFVENDIIVVHPYGTIHIAQFLRNALVEMHSLRLSHKELEVRSQNLMTFIKGDDFKNSVDNTIYRTRELANMLIAEHKEHVKSWEKRFHHYNGIHSNVSQLKITTSNILGGLPFSNHLVKGEVNQLSFPDLNGFKIAKNGVKK